MDVERVAEIIRKAKAVLPYIADKNHKSLASLLVQTMEDGLKVIREQNIPCPPELEGKLEQAFTVIERLYNKAATN